MSIPCLYGLVTRFTDNIVHSVLFKNWFLEFVRLGSLSIQSEGFYFLFLFIRTNSSTMKLMFYYCCSMNWTPIALLYLKFSTSTCEYVSNIIYRKIRRRKGKRKKNALFVVWWSYDFAQLRNYQNLIGWLKRNGYG